MDYWLWIDSDWRQTRKLRPDDMLKVNQSTLEKIDRRRRSGRKYSIHVSLNFHRARRANCINDPQREPLVLWSDKQAEDAFVHHWDVFARRYQGVPAKDLSFNLVNEAPSPRKGYMTREDYCRVMNGEPRRRIRQTEPGPAGDHRRAERGQPGRGDEMIPTKVAQSVHAYRPAEISHFRASWVDRKSTFRSHVAAKEQGRLDQARPRGLEKM